MNERIKWGLLFALERDLEGMLAFEKERPEGWDDAPWREDARNLVEALEWLIKQKLPHYCNRGTINRDLLLIKEKLG